MKFHLVNGSRKEWFRSEERWGSRSLSGKWLFLSVQLKRIKGQRAQQTLAHRQQPVSLTWSGPHVFSSPLPRPFWSVFLFRLSSLCVSQLICSSIKAVVLLLCIASELPMRFANTSALPPLHVKKIRRADWFVFVSRCSVAVTAIGNP